MGQGIGDGAVWMLVRDAPKVDFEYECIFFIIHISSGNQVGLFRIFKSWLIEILL